jgi:hypothetical protein
MSKVGSHYSFGYLKRKLWPKEGSGVKCQFASRPLKVGNRPLLDVLFESATRRWKALDESYNFALDLVLIGVCNREI